MLFSLESPHQGNSNENTQHTIINIIKEKIILNYPKQSNVAAMGVFPRDLRTSLKQPW